MDKLTKTINKLLKDVEEIELLYYTNGLDRYDDIIKYGVEERCESTDDEVYDIPIQSFFAPCVEEYFYHIKKLLNSDKSNQDKIKALRKEECYNDFSDEEIAELVNPDDVYETGIDFCFDFNLILLKNSILKNVLELNDVVDEPNLKLKKLEQIQYKRLINSEEFEILYGKSKSSQLNYRQRRHNSLPCIGGGKGSDLMYDKDEVEKWFKEYL